MKLTKEQIDQIFENAEHQNDYIIGLYRLVYPDFDQMESVETPEAGEFVCNYICKKCIEFDRKHHPDVMAGGAWLNWGFSANWEFDDWEVHRRENVC